MCSASEFLALSEDEYLEVMRWIYYYNVYDLPDNGYKKMTEAFGRRSLVAFFKVLFYFELIKRELYTPRAPRFLLPSCEMAYKEIRAMRAKLKIGPHEASLPGQHLATICAHCDTWASHIKATPTWLTEHLLVRPEPMTPGVLKSSEVIPKEMPPGKSWHTILLENGRTYCHRAKAQKTRLAQQRVLLRYSETMGLEADAMEADDDDEEEEDDDDDENAHSDEDDDDDLFSGLTDASSSIPNPAVVEDDEEEEDEEEDSTDEDDDPAHANEDTDDDDDAEKKKKKTAKDLNRLRKRQERNRVVFLLKDIRPRVLLGERAGKKCAAKPLLELSLCGVRFRYDKIMLTRCTFCGDLIEWTNEKRTNYGISCMHHAHPGEFAADHPHARKTETRTPTLWLTKCFYCHERVAKDKVRFFDALNRVAEAYICPTDLSLLGLSSTSTASKNKTRLLRPLSFATFLNLMNAGREKKKRKKNKKHKPLPIPNAVKSSSALAAAIERHPRWADWYKNPEHEQDETAIMLFQRFPTSDKETERVRWNQLERLWMQL